MHLRHCEQSEAIQFRANYPGLLRRLCLLAMTAIIFAAPASQAATSHAISVYGDIKYPPNYRHFEYANPKAPKGGVFILPVIGNYDNLNPYILKGTSAAGTDLLFDTLMASSQDETATSYGLVAKSVEFDDKNEWVIFNLRPEAKFSDGTPITADDIVFTFEILKSKGHPLYQIIYAEVNGVQKLGERKVKFTFSNSENRELKLLVGQLPVLSKKYYDKVEFNKTTLTPPLGSGPYLVDMLDAGRSITYKRNPNYWAKDLPVNSGKFNFDKFVYEYYLDTNVAIQALKSGAVDLRYENIAKNWANAYNVPAVDEGRLKKEKLKNEIPTGMQAFAINLRHEKFSDVRVRQALNLALDFEWMNKNLFYGSYSRAYSYYTNSLYAATGLPTGLELEILEKYRDKLPPELFEQEFKLPVSDGSGRIRDRLLEARDLLDSAGWMIKNGELVNAKGEDFEIEFLIQNSSSFERVVVPYQRNLATLGIKSYIKEADTSQYKKLTDDFDYDMIVNVWPESLSPGIEQMGYWHSTTADTPGGNNAAGIKNPVVDELVTAIIKAKDKETVVATTRALDRVLLWNYYVVPQWYIGSFRLVYWDKFNRPEVLPKYDTQYGMYYWWSKSAEKTK